MSLASKLARAMLPTLAVVVAPSAMGIDPAAFAISPDLIGMGAGFGLQRVVSDLTGEVVLLRDQSIKPGNVIKDRQHLRLDHPAQRPVRVVVVLQGNGYLISNDDLINQQVVNRTYSNKLVAAAYGVWALPMTRTSSATIPLAIEGATGVGRLLGEPKPIGSPTNVATA